MTRVFNEPAAFADEAVDGFALAFDRWVRRVPGGVVRRASSPEPRVAVVVGGGSGHYPAFGGLVGPGLAAGAALGNLFASPSAQQVHGVAAAAQSGAGVLLSYGNYAGDVLNFDAAQRRLRAEGVGCETVVVTDDIASAPVAEIGKRRGIAGDLAVFKVAAAAADAGLSLPEVARLARLANDRTRSLGVAFTGCTLPGASEPLFTVPEGRMAVGMGIHGEPGIRETEIPRSDDLAALLVDALLAERPSDGDRVVVLLNGLGSIKYEELFVVYRAVHALLRAVGATIVEPEVGELVTSFDMAGLSLTLFWLTPELEALWAAPANAPAYRKGAAEPSTGDKRPAEVADDRVLPVGSEGSRAAVVRVLDALVAVDEVIAEHEQELGRIDAVAGDGDHGIGMRRGAAAALAAGREAQAAGAGAGTVLSVAADAWSDRAGGTSGALWGLALGALGSRIGDEGMPTAQSVAAGVSAALAEITRFGKASVGDKTMVDALVPFADTLRRETARGSGLAAGWAEAAEAARAAASATARLLPRIGRARPHAERSVGTPDAGAVSLSLIVTAVSRVLEEKR